MVEHSTSILSKYQEFSNIFEKRNVNRLSKHQSYDCPIDIQDGACPPFGLIYRLSEPEFDTLHAYINENLMKGFIHHSKSTVGAPIPFVKQKGNDPQSLPTTFYSKAFGSPLARTSVLDNWSTRGLQPSAYPFERRMEDDVQNPIRVVWVVCHAIWANQRPCHIPTQDEW